VQEEFENGMLVIRLFFPSGRYKMNWPPSSFMLANNLAKACVRELPGMQGRRLESVLNLLSAKLSYALPVVTEIGTTGFVKVAADDPVFMIFEVEPSREQLFDLKQLLAVVKTFGSDPVWIDADITVTSNACTNCREAADETESVTVETLCSAEDYRYRRKLFPSEISWTEAVLSDKSYLSRMGYLQSPAMIRIQYHIAEGLVVKGRSQVNTVHYTLHSDSLPDVTDTLTIAGAVRRKLMGISRLLNNGDPEKVSQTFSAKNRDGSPAADHAHAYYLPFEQKNSGRLNKMIVYTKSSFSSHDQKVLHRLTSIPVKGKPDTRFSIESIGKELPFSSKIWISVTPFVTNRHHRRSRGSWQEWMKAELLREVEVHGIQYPEGIDIMRTCSGREVNYFETRRKNAETKNTAAFRLIFSQEQEGPFSLGALAHFGVGMFLPESVIR
jgi:CRISPR-associated protein Csb2